jgi:hypothetical protein
MNGPSVYYVHGMWIASVVRKSDAMIHLISNRATRRQLQEMQEALGGYIKTAVDVRREVLAGGGALHADCEQELLQDGSQQADIWGADWNPATQEVTFEALINIRPRQGNRSMVIQDPVLRSTVERIVREKLGVGEQGRRKQDEKSE